MALVSLFLFSQIGISAGINVYQFNKVPSLN